MHVVVTGGTGFLGKKLVSHLVSEGHEVSVLTRRPEKHPDTAGINYVGWLRDGSSPAQHLQHVDCVVNLAGESLFGRWTKKRKEKILNSRIDATQSVISLIEQLEVKPEVLVNASAVGYYGMSDTEIFTEDSVTKADDFLSDVVQRWEREAKKAEAYGVRTVFTRFGIILGQEGALPKMMLPYKLGVGGTVGSGEQWLSWVHIEDVVGMIYFAMTNPDIQGPINVTAPDPLRMKYMGKAIGAALNRPHWLPVPSFAVKLALGEMSNLLLRGQYVLPQKARESGYAFHYSDIKFALVSLT